MTPLLISRRANLICCLEVHLAELKVPLVCGCGAGGEPHPVGLVRVDSEVIRVWLHVGKCISKLEAGNSLDEVLMEGELYACLMG